MRSHKALDELSPDLAELIQLNKVDLLLYREYPDRKLRYLTTFTPEAFGLKQIRRRYGGGRYWVFAKRWGKIVRRRAFEIEGQPIIRRGGWNSATTAGNALGDLIDKLPAELRAMREKLETLQDRHQELHRLVRFLVQKDPRYLIAVKARVRS